MSKVRNSSQNEEQEKVMARDLIKTDVSNKSETELKKKTIIRILAGLEKSKEDTKESLSIEIEDLKTSHTEIKTAITEIQNLLVAMNTRMEEAEITEKR